jgi:hypothetical protein
MKRLLLTPLLLAFSAALASAGDDYAIKVYPCPRLKSAPAIDGALDDACWETAPLVSGFTRYDKPELMEVQTSFRVGYDQRFLYFAVHCDEPRADRLTPTHAGRDSSGCFRGETIEIFIDPRHDHAHYFQFAVNLAGSFYDSRTFDRTWNSDARRKTAVGADGWTLEFAVPWADLGVEPKRGAVIGFNVCRDRYAGGVRQWSNWAQTAANFHDPVRFAHLVLSPSEEMLGRLAAEFRKGDRRGPIIIHAREGYANKAYLAMARTALERLDGLLAKLAEEAKTLGDAATRAEATERIGAVREKIAPFRKRIATKQPLDAAEWTRMSIALADLEAQLGELLWHARLAALLKRI